MKKPTTLKQLAARTRKRKPTEHTTARRAGSNVVGHEYSPETGHLTVTFHGGRQYRYADVPKDIAERFRDSSSQGSFLHAHVIGKFDATKI